MPREFEKPVATGGPFRVDDWLVEPSLNRLSKGDTTIQLELKVMDVLVCLAERAGEVLSRQEIVDRVWATEFISDNTLTHAITELRNALGDDARNPSVIETIHRRGYRLIAPFEVAEQATGVVAQFPRATPVTTDEVRSPYPGLAAFTEADAEFFFGREDEVAKMWRKLTSRRLLAVIGPSGVGKSSFLRAGVIPASPDGWGVLVCQPGEAPFAALARALVPEFAGDIEATTQLVDIRDGDRAVAMVSRWRDRHAQALLIVDQFEELFTLNPSETQKQFATMLRRLADDANVHVLLSLRDDFLHRCHEQRSLVPVFKDLTPIGQPDSEALLSALTEPARRLGFKFEDEELPREMAAEVEGERSALPLLAFAVARLWEERNIEARHLTRQGYADIGGVGGALAQHAEATLKSIGDDRVAIVRELFRNLFTAEGTRAVREWNDLISVFTPQEKGVAGAVLSNLIDARLLTSFEEEDVDGDGHRRVEVVHESLLTAWPRLVRWQSQDVDAARLRDQLRQAARNWDDRDRARDYLWTGKAYREYVVWREDYAGRLTELENDFATAMTAHAKRRKRRRRIGVAAAFVVLIAVLGVVGVSRQQAVTEARRAEASKLVALGELELATYPTAALAWATMSLELTDTPEGRLLALRALQRGPPVTILDSTLHENTFNHPTFSPSGEWLATFSSTGVALRRHDGSEAITVADTTESKAQYGFVSDDLLITGQNGTYRDGVHRWWSLPDVDHPVRTETARGGFDADMVFPDGYFTGWFSEGLQRGAWWPYDGDTPRKSVDLVPSEWRGYPDIDPTGSWMAHSRGNGSVYLSSVYGTSHISRQIGSHEAHVWQLAFSPDGRYLASRDESDIRIWRTEGDASEPVRRYTFPSDTLDHIYDASGDYLAVHGVKDDGRTDLWLVDLRAPQSAVPTELRRTDFGFPNTGLLEAHPTDDWLVASILNSAGFWPLSKRYPWVFDRDAWIEDVAFTPDGSWLVSVGHMTGSSSRVVAWPMEGQNGGRYRVLLNGEFPQFLMTQLAIHPSSELVAVGARRGAVFVVPLAGGPAREFECSGGSMCRFGFSPDGSLMAGVPLGGGADEMVVRVWDLATGNARDLGTVGGHTTSLRFTDDSHLVWQGSEGMIIGGPRVEGGGGEVVFDLATGEAERRSIGGAGFSTIESAEGSYRLTIEGTGPESQLTSRLIHTDLETGQIREISDLGSDPGSVATGPSEDWIVTGGLDDGIVRVGRISGGEPHLLYGHRGRITSVKVSPDGRWIASGGKDTTLRLWPMPDLSRPPLHTLPRDELIAKLKTLTNLRVVPDEESSAGWNVEVGPFPGWETVPTW